MSESENTSRARGTDRTFLEIVEPLKSLDHWKQLCKAHPQILDRTYIAAVVDDIARTGLVDPWLGYRAADSIEIGGPNYREDLISGGLSSRRRAIAYFVNEKLQASGSATKVYAPEAFSRFAAILRTRSDFYGSEYRPSLRTRLRHPIFNRQDVTRLSLPDQSFDLYVSSEIMEHVTDIPRKISEARRILRPSGEFLATFPFVYNRQNGDVRAAVRDGKIVHFAQPEYHGPKNLVFTVPGWDILDVATQVGFRSAEMIAFSSRRFGILGQEVAAIFVLRAIA